VQISCRDPADRLCPFLDYVVPDNDLEVPGEGSCGREGEGG
jgi:hypothetical protein